MNLNYYYRVSDHLEYPELVEHRGLGGSFRLCKDSKFEFGKKGPFISREIVLRRRPWEERIPPTYFPGSRAKILAAAATTGEGGEVTTGRGKKVFLPPPRRFPQSSILLLATENKSLLGPPFSWGPGGWLVGREGEKEENYFPFLGWEGKMEEEDPGPKRPSFSNLMVIFSKNGKFKKRIARGKERQEGSHMKLSRLFFKKSSRI